MITQPTALVVVYNYKDRAGSSSYKLDSSTEEPMIIYKDIVSITTSKYKSNPAGEFTINLAPTRNWITTLSLSSWISIHISTSNIDKKELYSSKNLKMIGRISGVRVVTEVNQQNGAISTFFQVTGKDWGQIFESKLYIDSAILNGLDSAFKNMADFQERFNLTRIYGEDKMPTTTQVAHFFIEAWGVKKPSKETNELNKLQIPVERYSPTYNVVLPNTLVNNLKNQKNSFNKSNNLADAMKITTGVLVDKDRYRETNESLSIISYDQIVGDNPVWSLLEANCNTVVNEILTDIKWSDSGPDGKPEFILYKRIKPFLLSKTNTKNIGFDSTAGSNNASSGEKKFNKQIDAGGLGNESGNEDTGAKENAMGAGNIRSSFFNLKSTSIGKENITKIDCGINWENRINFIEIIPDLSTIYGNNFKESFLKSLATQNKADLLTVAYDKNSFSREGIRTLVIRTSSVPLDNNGMPDINALRSWVPVIRNWYFDTHKMINGGVTIIGKNDYIGVGENIIIPASALGQFPMVEGQLSLADRDDASILAHVEAVSNIFSIDDNGAASYEREVTFTRGVITDKAGTRLLSPDSFAVDTMSEAIPEEAEKPSNVYYK
jgi:hypothetical protein